MTIVPSGSLDIEPNPFRRFVVYNFKRMKRRSYYPNAQIMTTMTVTSSTGAGLSRPTTPLTPLGESPSLPNNYEMKEKELPPQVGNYDVREGDAF